MVLSVPVSRATAWNMAFAAGCGLWWLSHRPFPESDPVLQLIAWHRPWLFAAMRQSYVVMCFSTPFIAGSVLASLAYIFTPRPQRTTVGNKLPPYPPPDQRDDLFLMGGEVHHPKRPEPAADPRWLAVPERGLYTGV